MSDVYRIKSRFLTSINECIKKISLTEIDSTFTDPKMDDEGNFYTDVTSEKEPKANNNVEVNKMEKDDLVKSAIETLKKSLDINADLNKIINQIVNYDKKEKEDWVLNKDHCDLYLANKNAHIFKQNNNLCLSHNGKIEVFKSVQGLKDYLKKHNFPELPAVKLYESSK